MRRLVLAAALLAVTLPAAAEEVQRVVPGSPGEAQFSFAPVVKRVTPAVVNVYAEHVERTRPNPLFDDPFFRQFFGGGGDAEPRTRVQRSLGSGVIVEADGLVVTNYHVIADATQVKVALADKRELQADVILKDQRADLAVLRLKDVKGALATLPLAPEDSLEVGDLVLAVGDPFGVGQTVTSGIVSALARSQVGSSNFQSFIQTDAAINPGNSGGALVDMSGRLVGINTAIVSGSGGSIGIGFAIPAAMVRVVLDSAKAGSKTVRRPWLGATLQAVTPEIAESLGIDRPSGALVAEIAQAGPSATAGLATGDLIVGIGGVAIADPDEFGYRFATQPLGGVAKLDVLRRGQHVAVEVPLSAAAETTPSDETKLAGPSPLAGATVANLSPAVADALGLDLNANGVVITDVDEQSTAGSLGFQKKDVVVAVNGQAVANAKALARLAGQSRALWRVTISRDGRQITSVFGG
ncbi:Do family serine endopeptidase [Labrys wisconsinensis]|uniref:Do/DeqQ family serine protease n=1 Tax=Labrys wisconsinensis TaxID=425677 RepID=A0ABU0JM93_9HYPH|nr:Do family serine endopeptidase [Labrys wisconsinensis]MDQ0474374.1 Do/DeqQ family serine protease [Labrys wisconsinensis]